MTLHISVVQTEAAAKTNAGSCFSSVKHSSPYVEPNTERLRNPSRELARPFLQKKSTDFHMQRLMDPTATPQIESSGRLGEALFPVVIDRFTSTVNSDLIFHRSINRGLKSLFLLMVLNWNKIVEYREGTPSWRGRN